MPQLTDFNPRDLLFRLAPAEQRLREEYLQIDPSIDRLLNETVVRDNVRRSALFLELFWVSACIYESIQRNGLSLDSVTAEQIAGFVQEAAQTTRLDVMSIMREAIEDLQLVVPTKMPPAPAFAAMTRMIRSVIVACPISELESGAMKAGAENWGHRCRVAYDGIQAFLLRCDQGEKDRAGIVGRQYARGELTLEEVGRLLELHPVDAVALLEAMDYVRRVDTIRLADVDRSRLLERIRVDRLRRKGVVPVSREAIGRDVIASERIEGIDARRWISREHG
ncbi:MAG: hypothetical protein ACREL5_06240 [Gemmatimonadales bacterium]